MCGRCPTVSLSVERRVAKIAGLRGCLALEAQVAHLQMGSGRLGSSTVSVGLARSRHAPAVASEASFALVPGVCRGLSAYAHWN